MKKASSVFLDTLKNFGVDRFFCVPGESYLSVMDELINSKSIDVVSCRHEGAAGFMAIADAKCTGKAGIAFVSRGPGATNASIAIHSAHQGGIPMILFIGQVNRKSIGKMHLQEMDFTKTFSDMSKHVEEIINPEEIANVTAKAFKIAESGTPGPVVISIPTDVLESKVKCLPKKRTKPIKAKSDLADVEKVVNEILNAKRPTLVVGGQLQFSDFSKTQIKKISTKYALPVLCTYEHQDLIDNDDIHYAGELGLRPPEPVKKNALEADLVLCVGHKLNGVPNMGYSFPAKNQKFIHILPDNDGLESIFKTDLAIVSDGNDFLEKLLNFEINKNNVRTNWIKLCHDRYENNEATRKPKSANDGLDFACLIDILGKLAPKNSIIANDAGMGLNLDIDHVSFASNTKFDGKNQRYLDPSEIAQIAGRAGRSSKNDTFGSISHNLKFDKKQIDMVENHNFPALQKIWWRNASLDTSSLDALINSLEKSSPSNLLRKKTNAIDLISLQKMTSFDLVKKYQNNHEIVSLLWEICKIPDFGNIYSDRHITLLKDLFERLLSRKIDQDWINGQLENLNRFDGEIDTLLNRISNIRTWTYITNKGKWIDEAEFWQHKAKSIEDKLSDELHERLTKRFVDKKIVILTKKILEKDTLEAFVKFDGKVTVEDQEVGILKSFDFIPILENSEHHSRFLSAARKALPKELSKRVNEFLNSSEEALKIDKKGNLLWMDNRIGRLTKGIDIYSPKVMLNNLDMLSIDQKRKIADKCSTSLKIIISNILGDAQRLKDTNSLDKTLITQKHTKLKDRGNSITSKIKAIAFSVYEGLGNCHIKKLLFPLKSLNELEKNIIARLGLRIGTKIIYSPNLLKPRAISLRSILWSVYNNEFIELIPVEEGRVNFTLDKSIPYDYCNSIGFFPFKSFALRGDILERLSVIVRSEAKKKKFKITEDMLSIAGASKKQMEETLLHLGYKIIEYNKTDKEDQITQDQVTPIFEKNKKSKKTHKKKKVKLVINENSPFQVLSKLRI